GFFGGKIGRRIVEGEMPVLADADEGDVDGAAGDQRLETATLRLAIPFPIDGVESAQRRGQPVHKALGEVAPERCRVRCRGGSVSVQVKAATFSHATPGALTSSASISNCDAPVARMIAASPFASSASRIRCAPALAALRPSSSFVGLTTTFIPRPPPVRAV